MDNMATEVTGNGDIPHAPPLQTRQGSKDSQNEDDENGMFTLFILHTNNCLQLIHKGMGCSHRLDHTT